MKIVQSYWSKPYEVSSDNGQMGGWTHKLFHYMSCALSCLKLSEYYQTELVTDQVGRNILVDKIGLPYQFVKEDLEGVNYPTSSWAIGKIIAYLSQTEPFLHVDNDIYIWDKFPDKIIQSNLAVQSVEEGYTYNDLYTRDVIDKFDYVPNPILDCKMYDYKVTGINAGIIGGNNISFIHKYAKEAIRFVDSNLNCIDKLLNPNGFNLVFEQCLFYNMARQSNEEITCLIDEQMNLEYRELVRFWDAPFHTSYIHAISSYKRHYVIGEQVAQRLWYEYPDYFYRIQQLVKDNEI